MKLTPSVYTDSNVPIIFEKNLVIIFQLLYWVIVVVILVLAVIYRIFYRRYIKIIENVNQEIYRIKKVTAQNTQNIPVVFKSEISKSEVQDQEIRKYIYIDVKDECDKKDHTLEEKKIYIDVPYTEKNVAKRLGALWEKKYNKWYIPENVESRLLLEIWNDYNVN